MREHNVTDKAPWVQYSTILQVLRFKYVAYKDIFNHVKLFFSKMP